MEAGSRIRPRSIDTAWPNMCGNDPPHLEPRTLLGDRIEKAQCALARDEAPTSDLYGLQLPSFHQLVDLRAADADGVGRLVNGVCQLFWRALPVIHRIAP